MKNNTCREVWAWNIEEELRLIEDCLQNHSFITIDTEFPGCLRPTSMDSHYDDRYKDMCFNVERTKLIQLGFTLFDANDKEGTCFTWEINFSDFVETQDACNKKSIDFLKRNGLDFDRIKEE
ncbi:unnamed protein product [Cochlearia groenlandica]